MPAVRSSRISGLTCALTVLLCELVSRPFAQMGISDDWSYIRSTQLLASTGHIVYVGWASAMIGWQLYLGAAFVKLFGFSFTTVRMSTLLVAMVTTFVVQRIFIRLQISERNAAVATLTLALSPLFLMLSVTFMTDVQGLFAVVLCLYGCVRALQASTSRATIAWLCFAVVSNAICGSARQISWLGVLVMVPSALWLLRARRSVLLSGSGAVIAGALFIFLSMRWFHHQPYSMPDVLNATSLPLAFAARLIVRALLDLPFLLLPVLALFVPEVRKSSRSGLAILSAGVLAYIFLIFHWRHMHPNPLLEPTQGDWLNVYGIPEINFLKGHPPLFLHLIPQLLVTLATIVSLLCLITSITRSLKRAAAPTSGQEPPSKQFTLLLLPFTLAYVALLLSRIPYGFFDRYMLVPMLMSLLFMVRFYQNSIQPRLPAIGFLLIAVYAIYGITTVHNTFAYYRARVALVAELSAAGVPDTSVDAGFEANGWTQLQHSNHINNNLIVVPAHAYVPAHPIAGPCEVGQGDQYPLVQPRYAVSFDPAACLGQAPFAPVHYSRWFASQPGALYVVNFAAPTPPQVR